MPYKTYDDNDFDDYQGYDAGGSDVERLMSQLIGNQKMIQSTLMDEDAKTRTQITQTASEIRQEVVDADDNLQSQITQNAGEIDIRVREDDVISSINLTPETIGIKASKINFVGETSFTLGDGLQGKTEIVGGYLEATGASITQLFSSEIETSSIIVGSYGLFTGFGNNHIDEQTLDVGSTRLLSEYNWDNYITVPSVPTSTGIAGGHNHGIPNGTVLQKADGGTITWSVIGDHSHSI